MALRHDVARVGLFLSVITGVVGLFSAGCTHDSASTPVSPAASTSVAATISSVTPSALVASATPQTITVNGSNFQSGLTLSIGVSGGSASTVSGAQITNLTATSFQASVILAAAGSYTVQVLGPGATTSASNAFTVAVQPVAPVISGISPASLTASATAQTITINGNNFQTGIGLTIALNGGATSTVSGAQITNLTATSFQASVTIAVAGTYTIQITIPGGSPSNTFPVAAHAAAPTITSISPSTLTTSASAQTIIVNGSNFQNGLDATISANGGNPATISGAQITNVTATSFQASVIASAAGSYSVQVINPDTGTSNAMTFTAQAAAPPTPKVNDVSSITARAGSQVITVDGSSFQSGLVLTISQSGGASSTASGSQIANLTATSFQATATIATAGTYSFQVTVPGAPASNAVTQNIGGAGSALCMVPTAAPHIANISGQPIPQQVLADSSTEVGIYATIFEDNTPAQLCGGGLNGPCPYVDSSTVTGACDSVAFVSCGCISGGFEAHFRHTASSGTCSATFTIHDVCGNSGVTTLPFTLPPSLLDMARQLFSDPQHWLASAPAARHDLR